MAEARRGLGKGLGALISTEEIVEPRATPSTVAHDDTDAMDGAVAGVRYREVLPTDVVPNPHQPRQVFEPEALAELVHSIREIGLLQPIVVRQRTGVAPDEPHYEIVAGERRWRACQVAGLERIPAIVRDTADDAMLRDALLENLHRSQLNPLEEAAAYQQLLADFGGTQEELAKKLGRSRPQVANTLRLLKLPPAVQRRVAAGVISAGHARALLGLDTPEDMDRLAERIVAEGLSVRTVEEIVIIGSGGEPKKKARRTRKAASSDVAEVAAQVTTTLADRLDTRVRVEGAATMRARGRLVIEFADLPDLQRIAQLLAE